MLKKGAFITFEGIDGCGKTTQIEKLKTWIISQGNEVLCTQEPGGSRLGKVIRELILHPKSQTITAESELLLFLADRIEHVKTKIFPALSEGKIVLCDRYHDSTIAFQGGGRKLNITWLEAWEKQFLLIPDYTFWLSIPVEIAQERVQKRRIQTKEYTKIDQESIQFHRRIQNAYEQQYKKFPNRMIKIESKHSKETTFHQIKHFIIEHLNSS